MLGTGKPLSVDDFSSDERAAPVAREHLHLGPAVVVPLGPRHVRGVLTAGRRPGSMPLAPAAVEMLITFAAQAGIGLELAEHRRDAERLAVFEDRDRIARDLHDLVIQRLFATGHVPAGRPRRWWTIARSAGASAAPSTRSTSTIKEIRSRSSRCTRTRPGGGPSLGAQILDLVERRPRPLGFAPALRLSGAAGRLPADAVAEHLLAVLREALSNAARHAGHAGAAASR